MGSALCKNIKIEIKVPDTAIINTEVVTNVNDGEGECTNCGWPE